MGPLRLALKYIAFNKLKTLILIGCIFLTALLPIAVQMLLSRFNEKILARADETPILIGSKGSQLDLALHALYFKTENTPEHFGFGEVANVVESGLAKSIPLNVSYTAQKFPVVGTSIEYFDFRDLKIASGEPFLMLGDCVIGSEVAQRLNLRPGDRLLSDRENVIDLAGLYPLNMQVVGILAPTRSGDDRAVFVDVKTSWVIAGLGHGHQELADETDEGKILKRDDDKIVASAAVLPFTEINESNLASFHFHGDVSDFPITAMIAVTDSQKSATILEGRYGGVGEKNPLQFVRPPIVVRELMNVMFRVKLFFDANAIMIALSTIILMMLVILLSLRLRNREMETMFKIGCSRGTIVMLQVWEMLIIFTIAALLLSVAVWGISVVSGDLIESLL